MNSSLRNVLVGAVVVGLLGVLLAGLLRPAQPGNKSTAALEGQPAPAFDLAMLGGGQMSLERFQGKPIVLNFFASWCVPCKDEAPMFSRAAVEYSQKGVIFLGIAYNDKPDKAREFANTYDLGFPIAMDDNTNAGRTSVKYALFGVPETFFIDKNGVVQKHFPKPIERAELEAGLKLIGVE
jgi:cytochrome c biogenesis protein CcmG, thiol:disulfide interchange protein DsbE